MVTAPGEEVADLGAAVGEPLEEGDGELVLGGQVDPSGDGRMYSDLDGLLGRRHLHGERGRQIAAPPVNRTSAVSKAMDAGLRTPDRTGTPRASIRITWSHVQNPPRPALSVSTPSWDSRTPEAAPSGSAPTYTESSPTQNRPTMAMSASRRWSGGKRTSPPCRRRRRP